MELELTRTLTLGYTVNEEGVWVRMSDLIEIPPELKSHIAFNSVDDAKTWFIHQRLFTDIPGCLKVSLIMGDDYRAVFEHFTHTLDDWFTARVTEENIDGKDWHQDKEKQLLWFDHIREEFIRFFGAVIKTLRDIHSSGKWHGNLQDGIAIKDGSAYLYNMKERSGGSPSPSDLRDLQVQDYKILIGIIGNVLSYPDYKTAPDEYKKTQWDFVGFANVRSEIEEVENFCLVQLRGIIHKSVEPRWARNPALFWGLEEQLDFLRALHYIVYQHNNYRNFDPHIGGYFTDGWRVSIETPNGNSRLRRVLDYPVLHNRPDPYIDGMSKIAFRRNAIVHLKVTLQPGDRRTSEEIIHGLVDQEVDGCLRESLLAMNVLAQSTSSFLYESAQLICDEMKLKD